MITILVDTSFLIALADPTRANHNVAKRYFHEALHRSAAMYLSTIVVSEFQVKQKVTDLPLRNFIVLPFNFDHAMTAGELMQRISREPAERREVVKEDVKLIAQAVCESITHILTEDQSTLARYVDRLRSNGDCQVAAILLKHGFDESHFNGGQFGLQGLSQDERDA